MLLGPDRLHQRRQKQELPFAVESGGREKSLLVRGCDDCYQVLSKLHRQLPKGR